MDAPKDEQLGSLSVTPSTGQAASQSGPNAAPPASPPPRRRLISRRLALRIAGLVVLAVGLALAVRWYITSLRIVSTDDAYVNGHVTFVAPRVGGQVARVLVDDNNRVRKGDLLVELDPEPYQTQVNIAQAAVAAAQADIVTAEAQARGTAGQVRSLRFSLDRAIEDVDNQVALLRSKVAVLQSAKASLRRAQADYDRVAALVGSGAASRAEVDLRKEALEVGQARIEETLQGVYQVRVGLGLPPAPEPGEDLAQVPPDLNQTFATVREAQAHLIQAAASLGVTDSFTKSPKQMVADFYKRDPGGDINKIYETIIRDAPGLKQAQAKLDQAQRNLDQAQLNLRYCSVYSEIDGVVTRREVNPGNNVSAGQSLMAVRSVSEIWIDANFKETQLANLRIGQRVDVGVDMYGSRQRFQGRISGFTMGTGSTLALLPAENATGNFVKVVQRLPVRIELLNYDPDKTALFVGLSVTPRVHIREEPTGPNAGEVLQPVASLQSRTDASP